MSKKKEAPIETLTYAIVWYGQYFNMSAIAKDLKIPESTFRQIRAGKRKLTRKHAEKLSTWLSELNEDLTNQLSAGK